MQNRDSVNPVVIGGFVAALVIGAFAVGYTMSEEPAGPAEELGQSLDKAAQELKDGIEKSTN